MENPFVRKRIGSFDDMTIGAKRKNMKKSGKIVTLGEKVP